jgi:outer membrane protein assembly factor BamB
VESDGRLFLGGQDRIFRVDPGAGRRNGEQNLSGLPVALHALAIKEQVVVIGSGLRPVWSLHGKTLKESWILPREEHPRDIPAVLVQGLLLLFPLPKVVALDPKTGRDQWTLNLEAEPQVSWTPPAVRGSEVCVGSRGQLHAIDAKAGKPTWSLMAGSPAERATVPQPAWIGDRLYYSVGRRLHAFKLKP